MGGVIINSRPVVILGASGTLVSGAADTNENTLATIVVPAGAMGINGIVRVTTLWTVTNSANNKTLRVRFGGTAFLDVTVTTVAAVSDLRQIQNRASAASQIGKPVGGMGAGGWGTATSAVTTATVDTSAAVSITITGQKASAGETISLESYLVELITP